MVGRRKKEGHLGGYWQDFGCDTKMITRSGTEVLAHFFFWEESRGADEKSTKCEMLDLLMCH